jgi:hypothetical protein
MSLAEQDRYLEKLATEDQKFKIPFSLKGTPLTGRFIPRTSELGDMERYLLLSCHSNRRKAFILQAWLLLEKHSSP